jgi:uncharacterized cupin superfamily protein
MRASAIAVRMLALLVIVLPMTLHAAPEVVRLETAGLNAVELEAFEPWPDAFVISGVSEHAEKELHRGEFVMELYASPPTTVEISAPFPYDEFVWMLTGELVLTPKGGEAVTYGPGEGVVVSKGFIGT